MIEIQPFRIPKAIWLHGQHIDIEFQDDLHQKEDCTGHAAYRENKIRIQPSTGAYTRYDSQIEQTFFHELVHWILNFMGEDEWRGNEKFVELFSGLLHQALVMAEYD